MSDPINEALATVEFLRREMALVLSLPGTYRYRERLETRGNFTVSQLREKLREAGYEIVPVSAKMSG